MTQLYPAFDTGATILVPINDQIKLTAKVTPGYAQRLQSFTLKSLLQGNARQATNPQPLSHRAFNCLIMFCTGGIRCEKSTAYLKEQGFDEVYHLEGGILKYLEEVPQDDSLWQGECFVFDNRITVNHQLEKGSYDQCHACRLPLTADEMQSDKYQQGISCPNCYDNLTEEQRQRFEQRQKQMQLAQQRGEAHLGADAIDTITKRRELKQQLRESQQEKSRTN